MSQAPIHLKDKAIFLGVHVNRDVVKHGTYYSNTGMVEFLSHLQEKGMSIRMQPLSQHMYTTNK